MNILFMGTPQFSCPSLEGLVEAGHHVVGVVTRPDKPTGRGRKVLPPPVKLIAERHGLPVHQPPKVNAVAAVDELRQSGPDLVVVVAFGAILKRPLLTLAPLGAVNVHASLLPAYRGAAPVAWSLIHGERNTGVTTMLMDEGMDTGPMLERRVTEVRPGETAGDLLQRLARLGGELLVETLVGLESGTVRPTPQPGSGVSYAPMLKKEHGYLDFNRSASQVVDQFRGVTPAPGARVFVGGDPVLVNAARVVPDVSGPPFSILEIADRHIRVAAGEGAVDLMQLRPAGKKDMEGSAFARGRRLAPGDRLVEPSPAPDLSVRMTVKG